MTNARVWRCVQDGVRDCERVVGDGAGACRLFSEIGPRSIEQFQRTIETAV